MLQEFLESLSEMAVNASAPQAKEFDPTKSYHYRLPTGEVIGVEGAPPRRHHQAADLYTLCSFAVRFPTSAIWYNHQAIIALVNENDRRDLMAQPLKFSEPMATLIRWGEEPGKAWLEQRQMVFHFRATFAKCLPDGLKIVEILSDIDWEQRDVGNSNVGRGAPSLSRSVLAKVNSNKGAIPEQITLSVPVFRQPVDERDDIRLPIRCLLELNEQQKMFLLVPMPGEIDSVLRATENMIFLKIQSALGGKFPVVDQTRKIAEIPVYHGKP